MLFPFKRAPHSRSETLLRCLSLSAVFGSALLATTLPASADIAVRFVEGAPKDRFVIENTGDCALGSLNVSIDLGTAAVGLIFDTTSEGAGVEVFQPFEVAQGADQLTDAIFPTDGDTAVELTLSGLATDGVFAFTVDVDDTGENSQLGQIRVSDSEIAGASVTINGAVGVFGSDAATLVDHDCVS